MPYVLGFQPSRGDLMSMSNYSGTLFRQSLLDDFASVSRPLPNLIHNEPPIAISEANPFDLFAVKLTKQCLCIVRNK